MTLSRNHGLVFYKETGSHQTKARVPPLPVTKSRNRLPISHNKGDVASSYLSPTLPLRFVGSLFPLLSNHTPTVFPHSVICTHSSPWPSSPPCSLPLSHHSFLFLSLSEESFLLLNESLSLKITNFPSIQNYLPVTMSLLPLLRQPFQNKFYNPINKSSVF